jgi:hypothetical protein
VTPARSDPAGETPASTPATLPAPMPGANPLPQTSPTGPSDFCLRLLPGWSVLPDGAALRLIAPAGADRTSAAFRLELDILPGALKVGEPLPHDALIAQAKARLGLLRDMREDADARQIFSTPAAAGVVYRLRGARKSDGQETVSLVYALVGEGGTRTALLTPLGVGASASAFDADIEALLRTLRFLPRRQAPAEPTQEFAGRLLPGENRFYLWLRDRGDAEAVWKTTTAAGEEVSARFAGSYTVSGRLTRVAMLRAGGENPYVTRLLELTLQPAGGALQGTARLDQAHQVPVKELELVHVKFAQDRP